MSIRKLESISRFFITKREDLKIGLPPGFITLSYCDGFCWAAAASVRYVSKHFITEEVTIHKGQVQFKAPVRP